MPGEFKPNAALYGLCPLCRKPRGSMLIDDVHTLTCADGHTDDDTLLVEVCEIIDDA